MAVITTAPLLLAAARRPAATTPVWFMRQAGRYLPEYQAVRRRHTLLEICARPELAAEVTLQPVRRLGVDAAILYADILLPLVPLGFELSFVSGEGPHIANPLRSAERVAVLPAVDPEESLAPVLETLRLVRGALDDRVALIGFAGAPFTVASYAIEGGPSRVFARTRAFMREAPGAWHQLMGHLAGVTERYLAAQAAAGAQALQLFDSWAGTLSVEEYRAFVLPHQRRLFRSLARLGVPLVHFAVGAGHLLELLAEAGGDVIGLDWRTPLDEGWRRVGLDRAIQGNLDPDALFASRRVLEAQVRDVMRHAAGRPGHIFNLGHGIRPGTPVDAVRAVVDLVHEIGVVTEAA